MFGDRVFDIRFSDADRDVASVPVAMHPKEFVPFLFMRVSWKDNMVRMHGAMETYDGNALVVVHFANALDEFCIGFACVADVVENNIITFGEIRTIELFLGRFFGFMVQGCPGAFDAFADTFRDDHFLVFVIMMVFTDDLQYFDGLLVNRLLGLG